VGLLTSTAIGSSMLSLAVDVVPARAPHAAKDRKVRINVGIARSLSFLFIDLEIQYGEDFHRKSGLFR
jgi:hypothetical protein